VTTTDPTQRENGVVEATATEISTDVARVEQPPTTLFRTDDPVEVVERASRVADALKGVLDRQGLTANIQGKRHVLVEGWTTLGAMVGVTAVPAWTRPLEGAAPQGRVFGWEARVEARTLDGRVIGAAEAMCTRDERKWKGAEDYALRSMAQTRATSKALRGPLGFVVTLAGYQATPAEEMPTDATVAPPPAAAEKVTPELYRSIVESFQASTINPAALTSWLDEHEAPAGDGLHERVSVLDARSGRALKAWLDDQREQVPA
jgi:hypothetical protein